MSMRFVICVDVIADTIQEGYAKLHKLMGPLESTQQIEGWESTDEAFDNNGNEVPEPDLSAARLRYFDGLYSRGVSK